MAKYYVVTVEKEGVTYYLTDEGYYTSAFPKACLFETKLYAEFSLDEAQKLNTSPLKIMEVLITINECK